MGITGSNCRRASATRVIRYAGSLRRRTGSPQTPRRPPAPRVRRAGIRPRWPLGEREAVSKGRQPNPGLPVTRFHLRPRFRRPLWGASRTTASAGSPAKLCSSSTTEPRPPYLRERHRRSLNQERSGRRTPTAIARSTSPTDPYPAIGRTLGPEVRHSPPKLDLGVKSAQF